MEIQPLQVLYYMHTIVDMNFIVNLRRNVPFKLSLEHYGNNMYIIPKNQTVAHLLLQSSGVIPTTVNLSGVLELSIHTYCDCDQQESLWVFTTANQEYRKGPQDNIESTPEEEFDHTTEFKKDPLSYIYMKHLTDNYFSRLLTVLKSTLAYTMEL